MTGDVKQIKQIDSIRTAKNHNSNPTAQSIEPVPMHPITLADGATIQTWVHPGAGTPLVFLYGLGCSRSHWKYQVAALQSQGRLTVQLDYRGHGDSTLGKPARPLTVRTLAHDVAETLRCLNITEVLLLGQSMGGTVALQVAHDYPRLVRGLVLQGTPGRNPFSRMHVGGPSDQLVVLLAKLNQHAPRLTQLIARVARFSPVLIRELIRHRGFNRGLIKTEDLDEYINNFFSFNPSLFAELASDLRDFDVSKLDHSIDIPSLILAGGKDQVVPVDESRWLAKRLPLSELEIFPHGSHCPHLEDSRSVTERIEAFLQTYKFV